MIVGAQPHVYARLRPDPAAKLYWLNIDLNVTDIYIRHRRIPDDLLGLVPKALFYRPRPQYMQYCVLHGIGTVGNALTVGDQGTDFDHFVVDVASVAQSDDHLLAAESRPSAKMIWSEADPRSPKLEIFISNNMLRHLVELYVTKRINRVAMFVQIAVTAEPFPGATPNPEILPRLDPSGNLYFRHTQCELLSVYTSLTSSRMKAPA